MKRAGLLGVVVIVTGLMTAGCSSNAAPSSANTAAKPASSGSSVISSPTTATAASCLVGTWHASNVAITSGAGTMDGGAGATWTIEGNGDETVAWAGSGEFAEKGMSLFHYLGTETERVALPTASSTTGAWSAKVLTDDRQAVEPAGTKPVPSTAGVTSTGTWTCSENALTIDAGASGSSVVVTLSRAS